MAGLTRARGAVRRRPAVPAADRPQGTRDGDPERHRRAVRLQGQRATSRATRVPTLRVIGNGVSVHHRLVREEGLALQDPRRSQGQEIPVGFTANSAQRRVLPAPAWPPPASRRSDFDGVPVAHVVRGADDFMQGKVEASTFAVGAGKMAEVDAKVGGIRWLEHDEDAGSAGAAAERACRRPMSARSTRAGLRRHCRADQAGVRGLSGRGRHAVSDDAAYKIAKMLYENQDKLAAIAKPWPLQQSRPRATITAFRSTRAHQVLQGKRHLAGK